jgi:hypothetical protein
MGRFLPSNQRVHPTALRAAADPYTLGCLRKEVSNGFC